MMREIKFRAWDKTESQWIEINKMGFLENGEAWYVEDYEKNEPPYFTDRNDWELMQYTGLNDKNGREIYEGDVLEYSKEQTLLVHYNENTASFSANYILHRDEYGELKGGWIGSAPFDKRNIENSEMRVIGNAFENPDLLKGTSEWILKKYYPHVLGVAE